MIPQAADSWTIGEAAHLLNRAGFGGTPETIKALHALGRKGAVDSLLSAQDAPDAFPAPDWAQRDKACAAFKEHHKQIRQIKASGRDIPAEKVEEMKRELMKQLRIQEQQRGTEARAQWVDRMFRTKAPLKEKMTLFWHDHFATSIQKVRLPFVMVWQNELFSKPRYRQFQISYAWHANGPGDDALPRHAEFAKRQTE